MKLTKILPRLVLTLLVLLGLDSSSFAQKIIATVPVGNSPLGIAVNRFTNRIYVANETSEPPQPPNTVSVIDGKTNQVTGHITTGLDFQIGLGIDEFRQRIYVATLDSGVEVLDGKTNTAVANIAVANEPVEVAVNPFTKRVYVSTQREGVAIIDELHNTILDTIPLVDGSEPEGIAVNPIRNRVYAVGEADHSSPWEIDGDTDTATRISVPQLNMSGSVAVNAVTDRIYLPNCCQLDSVLAIDQQNNQVVATIPLGNLGPGDIAVDELRNLVYTCNGNPSGVSVVDGKLNRLLTTVLFANPNAFCAGIAVNPLTNRIYATNPGTDTVTVISGPARRRD